jgi:hypothetical protein
MITFAYLLWAEVAGGREDSTPSIIIVSYFSVKKQS